MDAIAEIAQNDASCAADCAVETRGLSKVFGADTRALNGVNIRVSDNEFFTLLGPSGCGKTTLLRLIAGFETPSAGTIFLFGEAVGEAPPQRRRVNTVFQHYALFPHLTVLQNVTFGLRMLGESDADSDARAREMLALVQMEDFAARRPAQLSGGQQQRVALARALAPRPKVLLLDEPLSALDLKLRQRMRGEIKALQERTGITFIFVTHDQEEALSMSDRIAVMRDGEVMQVGAPREIYEKPANRFVLEFIGEASRFAATVTAADADGIMCRADGLPALRCGGAAAVGAEVTLAVRPEKVRLFAPGGASGENVLQGRIAAAVYHGADTTYTVALANAATIAARVQNREAGFGAGDAVDVMIAKDALRAFTPP